MARSALRLEEEPMPWYDLPEEQLKDYRTDTAEPAELDRWWQLRLDEARALAREPALTRYEAGTYAPVEVYDTEFSGANGDRIKAWYLRPGSGLETGGLETGALETGALETGALETGALETGALETGALETWGLETGGPVVVKFIGYGGGRGGPAEHILLPALGYALLVMDTRGQGGRWTTGATGDHADGWHAGPENATLMTRGIGRPEDYYYTRLFTDAVRAVETACALAGARQVAVSGMSQGGGLALAAAALVPELVAVCHADVPFLCDIQRAITLAPEAPYTEIPEFLSHQVDLIPAVRDTLRYVDCALLARRITARCLLSVGLMDGICPPSTVYAAYNEITAGKDISVYPFTGHEVPTAHVERQLRHLREFLR
jgi:cephalosporin-C deacetylase